MTALIKIGDDVDDADDDSLEDNNDDDNDDVNALFSAVRRERNVSNENLLKQSTSVKSSPLSIISVRE